MGTDPGKIEVGVSRSIHDSADVQEVTALFRLNYDRTMVRGQLPSSRVE